MFGFLKDYKRKREIKQLNNDAPEIIEYAYKSFRTETVRDAALKTREHLERVAGIYKDDPLGPKRAIVEYQSMHAEAQRRRDDVALTAYTLMLIYLRAEVQGAPCLPARNAINRFITDWAHAGKED